MRGRDSWWRKRVMEKENWRETKIIPPPNPNKMRTSTGVLRRNNKRLSNRKKQLDLEGEKIRPKNTNWGRIR